MSIEQDYAQIILDSIAEGLITVASDFKIATINRAGERILGLKKQEVLGKYCKHILKSDLCFNGCPIAKVLESGDNVFGVKAEIRPNSGQKLLVRMNAAALYDDSGEPVGGVISFYHLQDFELMRSRLCPETEFCGIIGRNKAMRDTFQLIREISDTDVSVLIQGESGTGKEMIANAIQSTGTRAEKPFIKVNCSAFPPALLASELFGHVKGAFTGAVQHRTGRFEMADKGTLFLDEIVEMPPEMQVQLLRVLQEKTFERVGESITRTTDVRIIAATNSDIQSAINNGNFREDLYYRLNVVPIALPPLRERLEDIPDLVKHFMNKYNYIQEKEILYFEDAALDCLMQYHWPGNVRELENAMAYAFARTQGQVIESTKLPPAIRQRTQSSQDAPGLAAQSEREKLRTLLEKHQWNRKKVADELRIGRTTLWRKLKDHNLLKTE